MPGLLTVKMRLGFDDTANFPRLLELINRHGVDLLAVHGRTVKEMYRSPVRPDFIAEAVRTVRCPVLANGDITSARRAAVILDRTGAAGVMIGRHAIRNPWIFRQCRERFARRPAGGASGEPADGASGEPADGIFQPTLADVRAYIQHLYDATATPGVPERLQAAKMKKYLNFVGQGVDPAGAFLHDMRRAETAAALFAVCDRHLLTDPARPYSLEPHPAACRKPTGGLSGTPPSQPTLPARQTAGARSPKSPHARAGKYAP